MAPKKGYTMSEETKAKISEKRKGKQPALGHKKSQEAIEKIKMGNLGQKRSEETKEKIREARKRYELTKEKKKYDDGE
jgi:hypothetical protein